MTRAYVTEIDGQLVLVDPDAVAVVEAVARHNCRTRASDVADRIAHFIERAAIRGLSARDVVIVLINVDDRPACAVVAEALMPDHDWQAYRDRGEIPFARGLAKREGIQEMLDDASPRAAAQLREASGFAIVVMDYGTIEVIDAAQVLPWP